MHGGGPAVTSGQPLNSAYTQVQLWLVIILEKVIRSEKIDHSDLFPKWVMGASIFSSCILQYYFCWV